MQKIEQDMTTSNVFSSESRPKNVLYFETEGVVLTRIFVMLIWIIFFNLMYCNKEHFVDLSKRPDRLIKNTLLIFL